MMHSHYKDQHFRTPAVDLALEPSALHIRVHFPAQLRFLFEMLELWMGWLGYPRKDVFAIRLALLEATNNAFRHGNRRDATKSIHVRYLVNDVEVVLQVEDQGPGFDPGQVPDPLTEPFLDRPSGRGLFLMRSYMTWVSFNQAGNRVTFSRQRSQS
jgi:serine/threonine-protein kinase RsbW